MHATLDLADFCSQMEFRSVALGQPGIQWARAKRSADHLAASHLALLDGDCAEAMTQALTALERALWLGRA